MVIFGAYISSWPTLSKIYVIKEVGMLAYTLYLSSYDFKPVAALFVIKDKTRWPTSTYSESSCMVNENTRWPLHAFPCIKLQAACTRSQAACTHPHAACIKLQAACTHPQAASTECRGRYSHAGLHAPFPGSSCMNSMSWSLVRLSSFFLSSFIRRICLERMEEGR